MEYPLTSRGISQRRSGLLEEFLVAGVALGLTVAAILSPMALPLAVSGVVFILAALRFKPLLAAVIFEKTHIYVILSRQSSALS